MLTLVNEHGATFRLDIEGYEFVGLVEDYSDADWLVVSGGVSCARGQWTFRDPCLEVYDLRLLAAWLRDVRAGVEPEDLVFTAPNLRFRQDGKPGDLVVVFDYESAPPWRAEEGDRGYALAFPLRLNDLAEKAAAVDDLAARWPSRDWRASAIST